MVTVIARALLLVVLLAVASCGGGRRSLDDGYRRDRVYPHNPVQLYFPQSYGTFPYESPYSYDPLVRFPSETRLAPRGPSTLLDHHLAEFAGAFGGNFAELHQRLPYGYHALDQSAYVMASPGVTVVHGGAGVTPVTGQMPAPPSLLLQSEVNTVAFVTYGLLSDSGAARILEVDVAGAGSFALGDEHGLYIGVRQYIESRYYWYGPFKTSDEWRAFTERDSSFNHGNAAYITLAVFNGDALRVDGVNVDIGG